MEAAATGGGGAKLGRARAASEAGVAKQGGRRRRQQTPPQPQPQPGPAAESVEEMPELEPQPEVDLEAAGALLEASILELEPEPEPGKIMTPPLVVARLAPVAAHEPTGLPVRKFMLMVVKNELVVANSMLRVEANSLPELIARLVSKCGAQVSQVQVGSSVALSVVNAGQADPIFVRDLAEVTPHAP
jgi:hypothetical protein